MYLCITHSPRSLDFSRSSRSFLLERYNKPGRLDNLPEFDLLTDEDLPKWKNNLTVWDLDLSNLSNPVLLYFSKKDYAANHAVFYKDKLIICGSTLLEVCGKNFEVEYSISSNWFAGGHTVYPDNKGELVVACSGSDALLFFDPERRKLVKSYRMPEDNYGFNYKLNAKSDVRSHYINNDRQLTHLNCCFPFAEGYLVTAFIQGAVGKFNFQGEYLELTSGFVGCHGARTRLGLNGFYFSDTCGGRLMEMSWSGKIIKEFGVDSKWLHDCQWIRDDIYLFSLSDRNKMQLWDVGSGVMIWEIDMSEFGETTLLLSIS